MQIKTMMQVMITFYLLLIFFVSVGIYNLNNINNQVNDIRKSRYTLLSKYELLKNSDIDTSLLKATTKQLSILNDEINTNLTFIYIIMLFAAISFIFTYKEIRRKILIPIKNMNKVIILYQNGSKDVAEISSNDDEIGFMIKEFFIMKKVLDDDYTAIEKLALTDPLTGILNRRAFFEISENILKLAIRNETTFSVLILDIDFFKKVNDVYGHLVGDDILKFLVNNVSHEIRDSDIFARFGGEEFIALLPDTDEKGAYLLAEKIRSCIENNPYSDKRISVPVRVSVGVAELKREKLLRELIHRADEALYRVKDSGRNRVEIG